MSAPILVKEMATFRACLRHFRPISSCMQLSDKSNHISRTSMCKRNGTTSTIPRRLPSPGFRKFAKYLCTSASDRHCWHCSSELERVKERFFCNCGVVQYIPTDISYFELMQCEESFDIDTDKMSQLYKDLQKQYHPDKFSQRPKEEQDVAASQSSYINKAYTTLLKPLSRGLYLLELHGDPLEETNSSVDPHFLMEIMEINEDLAEAAGDMKAVETLEAINNKRIQQCVRDISTCFASGKVADAKTALIKLKYFTNVEEKIKEMHRERM